MARIELRWTKNNPKNNSNYKIDNRNNTHSKEDPQSAIITTVTRRILLTDIILPRRTVPDLQMMITILLRVLPYGHTNNSIHNKNETGTFGTFNY